VASLKQGKVMCLPSRAGIGSAGFGQRSQECQGQEWVIVVIQLSPVSWIQLAKIRDDTNFA
jgi:hypothetical protein